MNKILVVIDMQNDFISGTLGTVEAVALVPKVAEKIKNYDGQIFLTRDTHNADYLQTFEGKKLPVEHCIKPTDGWQIHDDILDALRQNGSGNIEIIDKPTFGSFDLVEAVDDYTDDAEEIELCGLCADICIVSNALLLRTAYPDMKIVVDSNLTEGVTPETKESSLATMRMCQIDVM